MATTVQRSMVNPTVRTHTHGRCAPNDRREEKGLAPSCDSIAV